MVNAAAIANWSYTFSSTLTEPPTGSQIRFDAAAPYTSVTFVWVRNLTTDGIDVHTGLMLTAPDSSVYVQDKNDHTLYAAFRTTGDPVDKIDYVELPVLWHSNGGTLLNQAVALVIAPPSIDPIPPAPGGATLITLPEAKTHLRITGTTNDGDISLKAQEASDIIRDYLKTWADPAWNDVTVPLPVKAAVFLMLTHLYEHRGDDPDSDEKLWDAITPLLMRFRDPALA